MARSHSSTPGQRAQIVALLLACAGVYGLVTALSRRFAISRTSLYAWRAQGQAALVAAFTPPVPTPAPALARAVLTLWVDGHATVRGIQRALPALGYPAVSVGTIAAVFADAQERALAWYTTAAPPAPASLAVDEIYGGRRNHGYCSVIDIHSYALWVATGCLPIDQETWTLTLWQGQDQGLVAREFVSDGGAALVAGCRAVAPTTPHYRDCWHLLHRAAQAQARFDRQVGALQAQADRAARHAAQVAAGAHPGGRVPQVPVALTASAQSAANFRYLSGMVAELLGVVVLRQGTVLDAAGRQAEWTALSTLLGEWAAAAPAGLASESQAVVTYLGEGVPAALGFAASLEMVQASTQEILGAAGLGLVGWAWQRQAVLTAPGADWITDLPAAWQEPARAVRSAWEGVARASSAVENWHSIVRPHLAVHRELSAGQMALLGVWHNHRVFARGAHAGQSPLQLSGVTGAPRDWLVALGYPPAAEVAPCRPAVTRQPLPFPQRRPLALAA